MAVLRDFIEEATQATNLPGLLGAFQRAAHRLDYDRFAFHYLDVKAEATRPAAQASVLAQNYPSDWVTHYFERNYMEQDPVVRHARTAIVPYCWGDVVVRDAEELKVLQAAGEAGLKHGLSIPIHEPWGRVFLTTLVSDQSQPSCTESAAMAQVLAVAFHARYSALKEHEQAKPVALTPRECECLSWVARGKSSWDAGQLMGVSEHTVNFHLKNAMRKLDTASRVTAAIRAASLGLIAVA